MHLTYYTLSALTREWERMLAGMRVAECYSQNRGELSISLEGADTDCTIVVVLRPERRLLFRNRGRGRARKNTAIVFDDATGGSVTGVRLATRDRVMWIDLDTGLRIQLSLFGPRPNVWLIGAGNSESFIGDVAPNEARSAPEVESLDRFAARLDAGRRLVAAVARAMPLFDDTLAREAVVRSELEGINRGDLPTDDLERLFTTCRRIEDELASPSPRVLWRGEWAEIFSLIPLKSAGDDLRAESFATVDDALRIFAHRTLAQERVERRLRPIETILRRHAERSQRSAERMLAELNRPSRADEHERHAHLLMAQSTSLKPGNESVTLPDILGDGQPVEIPLDPALSGIENAQRLYDRARRVRAARATAEARWEEVQQAADRAQTLLENFEAVDSVAAAESFLDQHEGELQDLIRSAGDGGERLPYRRFDLGGGFEAWVGRSARDNAVLTTRHARPHDLWLHARGVAGSHVIVRRDNRTVTVPRPVIEAAAAIAAHFSRARTSALVPVQVTERKHVRPLKGGPPGAMLVDREEVLLVEPRLPQDG